MKLASSLGEKMRNLSYIWVPPIYRRLASDNKREREMSERCLLKVKCIICPPPVSLSKVEGAFWLLCSANALTFLYF